jgi:hypothetical protein
MPGLPVDYASGTEDVHDWLSSRANQPLGSPVLRTTGSPGEPIGQVRTLKPLEAGAEEVTTGARTTRGENYPG